MSPVDLVDVVDTFYDLDHDATTWSRRVVEVLGRYAERDAPMLLHFDTKLPLRRSFLRVTAPSLGSGAETALTAAFRSRTLVTALDAHFGPPDQMPPVARLSSMLGGAVRESPLFRPFARAFGFLDVLAFAANDGTGEGVIVNFPEMGRPVRPALLRHVPRVLPHLAAALRLRRSLRGGPTNAPVRLDTEGQIREGNVEPSLRERLRSAVLLRDRAHTRASRTDPDAMAAWTALVEGRWSLVDAFERGGKRYVVALPNLPHVSDPRRLSPLERAVFSSLSRGLANKAIAYELGLAEGTVSGMVKGIRRKLREVTTLSHRGSRSISLPELSVAALVFDEPSRNAVADLTPAERAAIHGALAGRSNADIAASRGTSVHTVANQLASAYRKLQVGSRRELRVKLRGESSQ